jgi:hypothetical protein
MLYFLTVYVKLRTNSGYSSGGDTKSSNLKIVAKLSRKDWTLLHQLRTGKCRRIGEIEEGFPTFS